MTHKPIKILNEERDFDHKVNKKLKSYVYALRDPREGGRIFYVGKGGGAEGNSRVLAHFKEARQVLANPITPTPREFMSRPKEKNKIKRIHDIWKSGKAVEWSILHHGLDDQQALAAEAAVINAIGLDSLENEQGGHGVVGSDEPARDIPSTELYRWGAESVDPKNPYSRVFIFPIHKALAGLKGSAEPHLRDYEAVRGWWRIGEDWRKQEGGKPIIAIGLGSDRVSTVVVKVKPDNWQSRGSGRSRKWAFDGDIQLNHELLGRNFQAILREVRGYIQHGGFIAVEFGGSKGPNKRRYRIIRGRSGDGENNIWLDLPERDPVV